MISQIDGPVLAVGHSYAGAVITNAGTAATNVVGLVYVWRSPRPSLLLNAADPFLMPPGTPHNALDLGPDTGMMLSTYIVEVGKPLATFVDG